MTLKEIREFIKCCRQEQNRSQQWIADNSNMSRVAYSQFEVGNRGLSALELIRLAQLLNFKLGYFEDDLIPLTPKEIEYYINLKNDHP